jgi:hypothetical protein
LTVQESAAIEKLTNEVVEMRRELAVINTKLFGDEDAETEQGRIPRIEAELRAHARRIKRVEPVARIARALYALALALTGYLANHFFPIKGH